MSLDHNDPHEVYAYQLFHQYGLRPNQTHNGYSIPTKQFLAEVREAAAFVIARTAHGEPLVYRSGGQYHLFQQDLNALRRQSEHYHNMLLCVLGCSSHCDSRWRGAHHSDFAHAVADELAKFQPHRVPYFDVWLPFRKSYSVHRPHGAMWGSSVSQRRATNKKIKNKILKRGQS